MGSWAFIGLAYGVALVALLGYLLLLKRRLRSTQEELTALDRPVERRRG